MKENKLRVTINKIGRIPGVGNGPFKRPITISESVYRNLVKLGYPVVVVADPIQNAKIITEKLTKDQSIENPSMNNSIPSGESINNDNSNSEEVSSELEKLEKVINSEEVVETNEVPEQTTEEEVEGSSEELVEEETVEETEEVEEEVNILINDKDLSAEAYYEEDFLTSKNMCKKILDARQIQYEDSASKATLIKLVLKSNPEIEFEEE